MKQINPVKAHFPIIPATIYLWIDGELFALFPKIPETTHLEMYGELFEQTIV